MAKSIGFIAAACVAVLCFSSGAQQEEDAAPQTINIFNDRWVAVRITPRTTLGEVLWRGYTKNKPIVDDGYIIEEQPNGVVRYTLVYGSFVLVHMSKLQGEAEMRRFAAEATEAWKLKMEEQMRSPSDEG